MTDREQVYEWIHRDITGDIRPTVSHDDSGMFESAYVVQLFAQIEGAPLAATRIGFGGGDTLASAYNQALHSTGWRPKP